MEKESEKNYGKNCDESKQMVKKAVENSEEFTRCSF